MPVQPRRLLHTGIAALSAAAGALGCSGTVVSASDASTSSTQVMLSVDRTAAAGDPTGSVRAHASAYFLRLQAGADPNLAARLVGATHVLPAVGQCEAVGVLSDQAMPQATLGPVDLVDVGEVALEASSIRATFAARAFPDVADLVAGVVYTTRDLAADPLPDHGTYRFRIAGSSSVPPMTLEALAPGPARDLLVAGLPLRGETLAVRRGDLRYGGSRRKYRSGLQSLPPWKTARSIECAARSPTTVRRSSRHRRCLEPPCRAFRFTGATRGGRGTRA